MMAVTQAVSRPFGTPLRLRILLLGLVGMGFSTSPGGALGFVFHPALLLIVAYLAMPDAWAGLVLRLNIRPIDWVVIALAISAIGFSLFSPDPNRSLARSMVLAVSCALYLAIRAELSRNPGAMKTVLLGLSWSGTVIAAYYVINLVVMSLAYGVDAVLVERWVGGLSTLPWGASNTVAGTLLVTLAGSMYLGLLCKNEKAGRLARCSSIIMLVGVMCTMSRTCAVLAILMYLACHLTVGFVRGVVVYIAALSFLALLVASLIDFESAGMVQLVNDRMDSDTITEMNGRLAIWSESMNQIANEPFSPYGYYGSLASVGHSSHNAILTAIVEQTLIGAVPFISLWIYMLLRPLCAPGIMNSVPGRVLAISSSCIAVNMFFEDVQFLYIYMVLFMVLMAVVVSTTSAKAQRPEIRMP